MLCLILFCFVVVLFITSTTHPTNIYIPIYVHINFYIGPIFWGLINQSWKVCSKGRNQSPIDINLSSLLFDPSLRPIVIVGDVVSKNILINENVIQNFMNANLETSVFSNMHVVSCTCKHNFFKYVSRKYTFKYFYAFKMVRYIIKLRNMVAYGSTSFNLAYETYELKIHNTHVTSSNTAAVMMKTPSLDFKFQYS